MVCQLLSLDFSPPELKLQDVNNTAFICVGPPVMIKFTILEILKLGVPEENIFVERSPCASATA